MMFSHLSLCQSLTPILSPFRLIEACSGTESTREKVVRNRRGWGRECQPRHWQRWREVISFIRSTNARRMASPLIICVSPPSFLSACSNPHISEVRTYSTKHLLTFPASMNFFSISLQCRFEICATSFGIQTTSYIVI